MASRWHALSLAGALALTSVAVAACGDSTGPSVNNSVALFVNNAFVDYSPGDNVSEAWNMDSALVSYGRNVKVFSGITAAEITAAVKGRRYLVMPEQEHNCYTDFFSNEAMTAIKDFVANGGILIVGEDYCDFVNSLYGYSIVTGSNTNPWAEEGAAAGTPFAGIGSLDWADATDDYAKASLPAAAVSLFGDATNSVLFYIPQGTGAVVVLGADYFDMAPFGTQDFGWVAALDAATSFRP